MDEKTRKVIYNLQKNNMAGYYAENTKELFSLISTLIHKGETIGCGDSATLEETEVFEYFRRSDVTFYDKHQPDLTSEEKSAIYLKNFDSDIFITGTNAITMDGQLFNENIWNPCM
jgi:hypothetical protein